MSDVALRFGAKDDGLAAQFRKVNKDLEAFKEKATGVGSAVGTAFKGLAAVAAAAGIAKLASDALEFADAQKKMSDQTGLTVEQTQRLTFFAAQTSVEVGSLTSGVVRLQRVLGGLEEGSEASAKALERLGLANTNFQALDPEAQFTAVAGAVSGLATQNERVLAATELFGKAGAELLPVLTAIGRESQTLEDKFAAIGGAVGRDTIEVVDQLGDELSTTGLAAKSLATELLGVASPAIIAGLEKVQQTIAGIRILAGGGDNEQVNISDRIVALEKELELVNAIEAPFGASRQAERRRALESQIDGLRAQLNLMQGIGAEGRRQALALQAPFGSDFGITAPGSLVFEETDDDRAKRLKAEEEQRTQRIQMAAAFYAAEQQMALDHAIRLGEIDQGRIDETIRRETEAVGKRIHIQTDMEEFLSNVRKTFGLQEIKFEEIKNQSILEIASSMFGALARENTKLAKIQQGIALAQTIWSTASGIMKAFETLPWPASLVAAAKVAITGAIQVAKIKSTNYNAGSVSGSAPTLAGGGANVGGSSSGIDSRSIPNVQEAQGATTVYVSGMVTRDIVDYMIEGLREGFDRDVVLIPPNSLQSQVIRGAA